MTTSTVCRDLYSKRLIEQEYGWPGFREALQPLNVPTSLFDETSPAELASVGFGLLHYLPPHLANRSA